MRITVKTTFDFGKLARYVSSGEFSAQSNKILGASIAESSRDFIISDKVRPGLKKSTIEIRRDMGIHQIIPLYRTGELAESLKATEKGIKGADYGFLHLEGKRRERRNFISFNEEKLRQPFKELMEKVGSALRK